MINFTIAALAIWLGLSFAYYAGYARCERNARAADKQRRAKLPRIPAAWVTNVPVQAKDFETVNN